MVTVRLTLSGFREEADRQIAELGLDLETEIRTSVEAEISRPTIQTPAGAKGSPLDWAQLVVAIMGALPPLIGTVQTWCRRHPEVSVSAEIDGDKITIEQATEAERASIISAWLDRHES